MTRAKCLLPNPLPTTFMRDCTFGHPFAQSEVEEGTINTIAEAQAHAEAQRAAFEQEAEFRAQQHADELRMARAQVSSVVTSTTIVLFRISAWCFWRLLHPG